MLVVCVVCISKQRERFGRVGLGRAGSVWGGTGGAGGLNRARGGDRSAVW